MKISLCEFLNSHFMYWCNDVDIIVMEAMIFPLYLTYWEFPSAVFIPLYIFLIRDSVFMHWFLPASISLTTLVGKEPHENPQAKRWKREENIKT